MTLMKAAESAAFYIYISLSRARTAVWRLLGARIGRNVRIGAHTVFANCRRIRIGDHVRISRYCVIEGGEGGLVIGSHVGIGRNSWIAGSGAITIGDFVQFGPNVNILSFSHTWTDPDKCIMEQEDTVAPVAIGNDVWAGANVVILPDSHIGDGVVIAANSVVKGTVEPYAIVGGAPARVIGSRRNQPKNGAPGLA